MSWPSSQYSSLDWVLMWPFSPIVTRGTFHFSAKNSDRFMETYGSLVLATSMAGNGSVCNGIGAKLCVSGGVCAGESTSEAETSKAPFTRLFENLLDQCSTRETAKLWATRIMGPRVDSIARFNPCSHSVKSGLSHSC